MLRFLLVLLLCLQSLPAYSDSATAPEQAPGQGDQVAPSTNVNKIRVAILPFSTPPDDVHLQQYGEGTMDSLIAGLKNIPNFIMVDRGRIERVLKEQALAQTGLVDQATAVTVGKLMQAQVLITGSIQQAGDRLRITANFTDVQTGEVKDSQQVTGPDIFDLQDQLAGLFIKGQHIDFTAGQQQRVAQVIKSTASLSAYDYYLKGRKAYLRFSRTGYAETIQWYNKAIEVDPNYALAYSGLAETLVHWGYQKQQNGEPFHADYEQAYTAAQQALQLNPNLAEAHRAFGQAAGFLGKPGWAAETRQALALNPNDAETWYGLWYATGNYTNPDHEYILKALELNPDLTVAHSDRGGALDGLQRYDEAIAEYRLALRSNPDDTNVRNNLGVTLTNLKRFNEAITELREAMRINPGEAYTHNNLGNALRNLTRFEEAVTEYREAIRINPNYANAHINLGQVLYGLKRYEEAALECELYLQFAPNAGNAAQVREFIQQLRGH